MTTPQLSAALVSYSPTGPNDWRTMLETARLYDRVGIDRLVISDHVVFGEQLDAYGRPEVGGTRGGKQPTGPDGHWLEPMTTLSVIAGMTERIRLATGILLAALRRPVVLAKQAATLDVLSGGRLDLGVGVGWQREEYEAAGLDFDRRGRLLDHTLEVCTALWTEGVVRYQSPELELRPHPHDAEAVAAGRRPDLGERHHQRARRRPVVPLRAALDPVGRRRGRPRNLDCEAAGTDLGLGGLARRLAGRRQRARRQSRRRRDGHRSHDVRGVTPRCSRRDELAGAVSDSRSRTRRPKRDCAKSSRPFARPRVEPRGRDRPLAQLRLEPRL